MGRTKKMITVETERVTVISRHGQRAVGWCEKCGEMVQLLSEKEVLERAHAGNQTIAQWAEQRRLHGAETPEGTVLVCPSCVPRKDDEEK